MKHPTLAPCTPSDIPSIHHILDYYVQNTVITLAFTTPTEEELLQKGQFAAAHGLPFIVAKNEEAEVIGYAYCGPFKERKGYRHTVELSLFCHPDHVGKGIGAQLLTKVIDIVKSPEYFLDYITKPRSEDDKVRTIMACMSVDETAWNNGLGLRDFYQKHGFEQVGYMKKVGEKMGRW